MLLGLIVLTAGVASAMPANRVVRSESAPSLSSNLTTYELPALSQTLRINGELVGASVGTDVIDIYEYALKYREQLQNPDELSSSQNGVKIRRSGGDGPYIGVDYTTDFKSCVISQPILVSSLARWYCNSGDKCQTSVTLSTSSTETSNYGYKIGTSVKASAKFGDIGTEVTVTGEFNQAWTNSKTTTMTKTDQWTILYGQTCQPVSYQFSVDCDSKVSVTRMTTFNGDGTEVEGAPENLCTFFTSDGDRGDFLRGAKYSEDAIKLVNNICSSNAKTDTQGNIRLDLNNDAMTPTPMTIQGCRL